MQRVEKTSGRKREKSLARERCQVWMKYALIDRGNNANRETEALISKNQHNKSQQCQLACHLKNSLTQPSSSLQFVRIIFIQLVFIFFLFQKKENALHFQSNLILFVYKIVGNDCKPFIFIVCLHKQFQLNRQYYQAHDLFINASQSLHLFA